MRTASILRRALACGILAWMLAAGGCATPASIATPPVAATADAQPAQHAVVPHLRRDWTFPADGVVFDNRLPAARLNDVTRLAPGHYRLRIEPEILPVNPSPWYGFRVATDAPRALALEFDYPAGYRHRYVPKLSTDGHRWREAPAHAFSLDDDGRARLQVEVGSQPLQVFAQPPLLPADVAAWTTRLGQRVALEQQVFGRSLAGRPLHLFAFGGDTQAPLVLVIGRQHPPENTGHLALMEFVDALAADTPLARDFRRRYRVLVAPMLNPDGVVEGHWRGNLAGADLNRDWGPFAQPETRALRDALEEEGERRGVAFAIDFHSTFRDMFYTVDKDPSRRPGGVLHDWIQAMHERFPGRIEVKTYAATSAVFKNWAYCRFGAAAVTYEVGDATTPAALGEVSGHAASSLMGRLMAVPATGPAPGDCPGSPGSPAHGP